MGERGAVEGRGRVFVCSTVSLVTVVHPSPFSLFFLACFWKTLVRWLSQAHRKLQRGAVSPDGLWLALEESRTGASV